MTAKYVLKQDVGKPWTPTEDTLLLRRVKEFGHAWRSFRVDFPDRSYAAVRNRYTRITQGAIAKKRRRAPAHSDEDDGETSPRTVTARANETSGIHSSFHVPSIAAHAAAAAAPPPVRLPPVIATTINTAAAPCTTELREAHAGGHAPVHALPVPPSGSRATSPGDSDHASPDEQGGRGAGGAARYHEKNLEKKTMPHLPHWPLAEPPSLDRLGSLGFGPLGASATLVPTLVSDASFKAFCQEQTSSDLSSLLGELLDAGEQVQMPPPYVSKLGSREASFSYFDTARGVAA